MTTLDRQANLRRIAKAARHIETLHGIPAELTVGQCVIESKWLEKCPANNCFGLKAPTGATHFQTLETSEHLTDAQLAALRTTGRKVISVAPNRVNSKWLVRIADRFQAFSSLEECFEAYADLLLEGKYFKPRFERFREHGDVYMLLADMSGADGQPPYFTGSGYVELWTKITNQSNVKAAIAEARAATETPITGETKMGKFIATDATQNATLAQAKKLVRQRTLVGLPSFGIYANAQGAQEIVPEADFTANKIDGNSPACLLIKVVDRPDREDSAAVNAFDDYVNVGETLEALGRTDDLTLGVVRMIENEKNKIGVVFQPGEAQRQIANIKAVTSAAAAAFEDAWNAA